MEDYFQIPAALTLTAVFTWALSGAIVGVQKGFDAVGVFVLAAVSSFGGGIIRDGLFLNRTPVLVTDPLFLSLVLAAVLVILVVGSRLHRVPYLDKLTSLIDAIGTPAFCIIGLQMAKVAGLPLVGVLFIGVISGVGGGVLRDMMVGDVPAVLQPGQFNALVVLGACVLYLVLSVGFGMETDIAGWITVAAFVLVRTLTIRYNWRTVAVSDSWSKRAPSD